MELIILHSYANNAQMDFMLCIQIPKFVKNASIIMIKQIITQ